MQQNWKTYKLGDISNTITYGYTESASKENIGPKFLRITDIQQSFISWDDVPYCPISNKDFEKYRLEIGDIVIARTGNSTGANSIIKDKIQAVYASYLIRYQINLSLADPLFVSYLLRSKKWSDFVDGIKGGSAQPGANAQQFAQFEFNLPPLPEQTAIASILSALDDKIELNLQQNKTLEEMAMALYKHWFVDFGPFQEGEFVESELGMIPKGWEVKNVYSIASFINGAAFKGKDFVEDKSNGLPVIKIAEIKQGITSQTMYSNKVLDEKYIIENRNILFPWSGNPHTSLGIHLWDKGKSLLNQHIFVVRTSKEDECYVFNTLKHLLPTFINLATHKQTTGLGHVTVANLKELLIAIPNNEKKIEYSSQAQPILDQIYLNQMEKQTLTNLRDSLLPKLISGEVRVKELEALIKEVL